MLVVLGTIWPMITFPLVLVAAIVSPKRYRWRVLFITPIVLILPCILFVNALTDNSNLLFAVIMGFAMLGWAAYYLVLIVVRLATLVRSAGARQT